MSWLLLLQSIYFGVSSALVINVLAALAAVNIYFYVSSALAFNVLAALAAVKILLCVVCTGR